MRVPLFIAVLFVLAWSPTLTPMHRLYGFGTHAALIGLLELAVLVAAAGAIVAAGRRGAWRALAAAAAGWIALTLLTAIVEPSRDRSAAAQRMSPPPSNAPRASQQVLLISVDGMDWNQVERMVGAGKMPTLARLLADARTYALDNHGLGLSPAIWARAYTGTAGNPIQGFTSWRLRGTDFALSTLPQWRHRPLFMLDRALNTAARVGVVDALSPSNMDFVHPPFWRIASAAGRRVGVFDPLPFDVVGERVNGFFAWQADEGFRIASGTGPEAPRIERITDDTSSESFDSLMRGEAARASIAARAIAREKPDIAVYYTHVVDAIGHMIWEPGAVADVRAARAERRASLTANRIAAAYAAVDESIRTLQTSFGEPAIVIVASDHGWEFNEYAHRTAPLGMAIVAGTGKTGYGGTIPVESLAGTTLALARVPVPASIAAPLRDVVPQWATCSDCPAAPAQFLSQPGDDIDRRNRLRSLGYTTR